MLPIDLTNQTDTKRCILYPIEDKKIEIGVVMQRRERLSNEQLTELQKMITDKANDSVEVRRAQAILLINEKSSETTITTVKSLEL